MATKIWLINEGENLPGDDNNPRLQRMGLLAYELTKMNDVEIVWWHTTFNHNQKTFRCHEDKTVRLTDNMILKMINSCGYKKNVCVRRMVHEYITAKKFYKQAEKEERPDVIVVAMPTIASTHYAVKFGNKHNIPVLVDCRDLQPDVYLSPFNGLMKQCVKLGIKPLQRVLGKALKNANGLIGTTDPYLNWGLDYAGRERGENDRVYYVSYPDKGVVKGLSENSRWAKYKDYEGIICCFFGQFGHLPDFDTLIEAAGICQDKGLEVKFLICGKGELLEHYQNLVKEKGLHNVELPGWVNQTDILDVGFISDVGLMAYYPNEAFNMQMPNKFSEYLSLGLAILLQPTGIMQKVISDNDCGVRYETPMDLYNALKNLSEDREKLARFKKNSRALFERDFSVGKVYKDYSEYIIKNGKK